MKIALIQKYINSYHRSLKFTSFLKQVIAPIVIKFQSMDSNGFIFIYLVACT